MTEFAIISAGRNCSDFIESWYASLTKQTYPLWKCYVALDPSEDGSENILKQIVGEDARFKIKYNKNREWLLRNMFFLISQVKDSEMVIGCLDLDDNLLLTSTLSRVAREYEDKDCWMTYGSFQDNLGRKAFCSMEIEDSVWKTNSHRKSVWSASHFRTFKKWLWDKIDPSDFLMPDGSWIKRSTDRAFMYPMLEMSGKKHVRFIKDIIYHYNVYGQQRKTHEIEMSALRHIISKRPYDPLKER